MKPEQAERFFIEELFAQSQEKGHARDETLDSVDKLTGDASTRRYYRLFTDKNSYVVCLDNPQLDATSPHPFVSKQKFLDESGVRVTKVIDSQMSKGYILEEDLGDETLLSHLVGIRSIEDELKTYSEVIDQLIALHQLDKAEIKSSGLFDLSFDLEKYMQEMDFTFKFFFDQYLKVTDPGRVKIVREELEIVCKRLAAKPMVLTHRDFHSRNIMVKKGEKVLIDFQDARWGIPQYDLVSILEDCYYEIHPENKKILKKKYFEELPVKYHEQQSWNEFDDLYDDMLIQRVFKAVGSFSYIYATRQDVRYLKYIGFGMEKIRATLINKTKYNALRSALFGIYYAG